MERLHFKKYPGIYYLDDGQVPDNHIEALAEKDRRGRDVTRRYIKKHPRRFKKPYRLLYRTTKMKKGKRVDLRKVVRYDHDIPLSQAAADCYERMLAAKKEIGTIDDRRLINAQRADKERNATLAEAWDAYMLEKREKLRESTRKSYESFFDKHIRESIGAIPVTKLEVSDLEEVLADLKRKGLSRRTQFSLKQILHPLLERYRKKGLIPTNPTEQLEELSGKLNNEVEVTLSTAQKSALMQAIKEYPIDPYRGIFAFLAVGRRLNEVLTLRWENVNMEEGTYTIVKERAKTGKESVYPLLPDLVAALEAQIPRKEGWVFRSVVKPSQHVDASALRRHWRRILDAAGIEYLRIHDLRHLIGNTLVSQGFSLEQIGALLGHRDPRTTRRYSKAETQSKAETLEAFRQAIGGASHQQRWNHDNRGT